MSAALRQRLPDAALAAWIGMATIFLVRAAAIRFRIKLPSFHAKADG